MILEEVTRNTGIEIEGDLPPKGNRTNDTFRSVIVAVRKAENEMQRKLDNAHCVALEAQERCDKLRDQNEAMRTELLQFKLKERAEVIGLPEVQKDELVRITSQG